MPGKPLIGLDISFLNVVIEEGGLEARTLLARQTAALLRDPNASAVEKSQIVPIVLKLAGDNNAAVRRELAQELIDVPTLDTDLILTIAADSAAIALPFIASGAGVKSTHLLAILKAGDEERQIVVARRPDLTDDVKSHILENCGASVVLELLANSNETFTADDFNALYERFGQSATVMEELLLRTDLPSEIRLLQTRRVASRMKLFLAENDWAGQGASSHTVDETEELTVISILLETPPELSDSLMTFMAERNMITPSLAIRAAATGRMRAVELVIQHLTGTSLSRVRDLMYARGASGFKSIYTKSGLPLGCFGLMLAACTVATESKEEGVPLTTENFGRRVLESLMTRHETMSQADRTQQIEHLSHYADPLVRKIARKLKSGLARAA